MYEQEDFVKNKCGSVSLLLFTFFLISSPIDSWSQLSVASLWKARALEAKENLESLVEKTKKYSQKSKEVTFLNCQMMIEFAFLGHLVFKDITHKKEADAEAAYLKELK